MAINAGYEIERLLRFGLDQGMFEKLDQLHIRNSLLDLLQVSEPYTGEIPNEAETNPIGILNNLLDYAAEAGLLPDNTTTYRDLMDARIMGFLMPRQSEVVQNFRLLTVKDGVRRATDYFYKLSTDSNYIRMDRIQKNRYWLADTDYGQLEITINLSKPEKDPKEIAAERNAPQSSYPKCLLCVENVGYAGRVNHPARQNHRVIPLQLEGRDWFFQYSPYVYYNEHCIIFDGEHVPMKISDRTFARLLEFVGQFPHYFVGSNADLPIVGGSILSHDHFQGGRHQFPMEKAPIVRTFTHASYPGMKTGIVKWPMSVIRLSSAQPEQLLQAAAELLAEWREYSDESAGILAYSETNGQKVPHNTITPIARKNAEGEFELDLVLRNNRQSVEHPDGIYHPHKEIHHIKKENIGLIEVMGLAVLPGRLQVELEMIRSYLTGQSVLDSQVQEDASHVLNKHAEWIGELVRKYGSSLSVEEAEKAVQQETGIKFLSALIHCGVYKQDEQGYEAFDRFTKHMGFQKA